MIHRNWQELIRPTQLDIRSGGDPARRATLVAEPLERGFGLTLGNALRRVLLSSLQGAAIVSVQIDTVLHEFSSIAGVREDVTDLILNLKGVAIRMQTEGPKRLTVTANGPSVVKAGDIRKVGGDRDPQPRPRDLPSRRGRLAVDGTDRGDRQGLCRRRQEPARGCADRPDPDRCDLLAGTAGVL
jgi:hypothetical protein